MEAHEYQTLFEFEPSYWRYRALHSIVIDTLNSLRLERNARVLDAGCGTGYNLLNITRAISPRAFGLDVSPEVVPFWRQRDLRRVCLASVNDLPFPDGTFDAVVSLDVLDQDAVIETAAYRELWRVVREDGLIVIVVPAYKWLLTKEHHRAVHASRRYTERCLLALLKTQSVELVRMSHLFALLLPVIAAYRLARRLFGNGRSNLPRSELRRLPPVVNDVFCGVMNLERLLLRKKDLPFGSSLLAVVRKTSKR